MNDKNLHKKAEKAKRDEYVTVYGEYYNIVFNTVFTKVGNESDTSDICQEIFLLLYEKFEEIENYKKWLLGTLRNVTMRYYEQKSKKSTSTMEPEDPFEDISLTFVNGMRDARMVISDIIENLEIEKEERLILDYVAFSNYSYSNVGEILGLSKKQVYLRYTKVVKLIMAELKKAGINKIEDLL